MADPIIVKLTVDIVAAHVANNDVASNDLPALIRSVHAALTDATNPAPAVAAKTEPAVPIRSSVKQDYIVCLEDGAKLKMLKRYLRTKFDMSPDAYRAKWNLPRDYPMVAPAYAETRRTLAKAIGLGRRKVVEDVAVVAETVKLGARKVKQAVDDAVTPATKPARKPRAEKPAAEVTHKPDEV